MIVLNLKPTFQLTDEVFEQLCHQNPDLRLERTVQGELIAMAPAGSENGGQLGWLIDPDVQQVYQKFLGLMPRPATHDLRSTGRLYPLLC